ncbi:MAG: hypothetical protein WC026_05115 [Hyphomicrobium sp.]
MHLAHGAIGKRDDFNAGVLKALVNPRNVLEVAGKPVERFRQHGIEPACASGAHKFGEAGAVVRCRA